MCPVTLAALFGLAASACALEQSGAVLAPADPHVVTHWKPDPLFGGVKTYRPVGPKAWGATHDHEAPAMQQSTMPPMMDHRGMSPHDMEPHHEMPHEEMQHHDHMQMDHHHMMNMDGM